MTPTANDLTKLLLLEIPRRLPGARAWRRNTGGGYPVATVQRALGMLRANQVQAAIAFLATARPVSFGLPGEPDVDGFLPLLGPSGEPVGCRIGVEVKAGRDRQRDAQRVCQQVYERAGCIYVLAHDVERAIAEITAARAELARRIYPGSKA
jgi:hypothetical protein